MSHLSSISFIIVLLLSFLVCSALCDQPADNEDYSWPMFAGNLQRNGRANQPALKGPNMTWAFFSPNSADFEGFPMYDYINELIWVVSSDGFLYKINATNGTMISEICVGKAPEFEGDPCGGVFFDNDDIFGKISMLSTRDVVFIYNTIENNAEGPNVMVAVSHTDDSILWKYEPYKSPVDPTGNFVFASIPTVIPLALNNLSDAIIVWINNPNSTGNISGYAEYTIIDSLKGAPVLTRLYPTPNNQEFPAMAIDPSDGNVISMYVNDLQPECGADYEQFFLCTGIGKFHTLTGESIWNASIQESYAHGIALSSGNVYISTTQLDAFSFTTTGKGRWKNPESTSTYDMFLPSVCSDETVIYTDDAQFVQGWGIKMTRPMKPLFWEQTNGPVSKIATTTNDQVFYTNEGNSIYAHSCVNGSVLWSRDFGDGDSFFDPVTIGYKALYANVYKSGTGGAVIKLEDLGGLGDSQKHAFMW